MINLSTWTPAYSIQSEYHSHVIEESNVGREFLIVFMENQIEAQYFQGHSLLLYVSVVDQEKTTTTLNVTFPREDSAENVMSTYTATRGHTLKLNLPYYLRVTGSTISNKVVHVKAMGKR